MNYKRLFLVLYKPWKYLFISTCRAIITPISGFILVVVLNLGVFETLSSLISSASILLLAYFYYTRKKFVSKFSFIWAKK